MAKLKILEFPDPQLRIKAQPVETVDNALRRLIDDMFETMYDAPGIGLAATQIDVHRRLLVADVSTEKDNPRVLINPEIVEKDGVEVTEEGCLSVPGQYAEIDRPNKCHIRYLDYYGKKKELRAEGLLATCIQHEMDHLEGILFIDYLSKLKKTMIIKKLSKQKKEYDRIVI